MNIARILHLGNSVEYVPTGGKLSQGYELDIRNAFDNITRLYSYTDQVCYIDRMENWIENWKRFVK